MSAAPQQMALPAILDACCGPRMMWFDKADPRALFLDRRVERHEVNGHTYIIEPSLQADFKHLPFADESFSLVVFDPPHITPGRSGKRGRFKKMYGVLPEDWRYEIGQGFKEIFRVLKPSGTLIFKWSEVCFPVREVLRVTDAKPLFGHKTSRNTHWIVFMKETM